MAKKRYKIPTTLDVSYFDMEFNLKTKDGLGFAKPVSAKLIVLSLFSLFAWFYLVFQTFIVKGGVIVVVGFTLAWILFSVLMVKSDKTKRAGIELVISMFNYIPKAGRYVPVRMSDSVYKFQSLLNVKDVDPEDGLVYFLDGAIGHVYHVVGSASSLMFEQDKVAILDKVDSFYRKLPVGIEIIYDTVYEGHSVEDQIRSVKKDIANLQSKSKGLRKLLLEQKEVLEVAINNNQGLTSLHQYLVVRVKNEAELQEFESLVVGDVENQGLMFRLVKTLNFNETLGYFRTVALGIDAE